MLEYWLDVSLLSDWKRNAAVELSWNQQVFMEDIDTYSKQGIQNITSFAVYIDATYLQQFGDIGFLTEYGNGLFNYRPK